MTDGRRPLTAGGGHLASAGHRCLAGNTTTITSRKDTTMPTINTTPRADLDTATERLTSTAIALSFLVSLPENQRAGYVKALLRFKKARQQYHAARTAYLTAYPHREAQTPVLIAAL